MSSASATRTARASQTDRSDAARPFDWTAPAELFDAWRPTPR